MEKMHYMSAAQNDKPMIHLDGVISQKEKDELLSSVDARVEQNMADYAKRGRLSSMPRLVTYEDAKSLLRDIYSLSMKGKLNGASPEDLAKICKLYWRLIFGENYVNGSRFSIMPSAQLDQKYAECEFKGYKEVYEKMPYGEKAGITLEDFIESKKVSQKTINETEALLGELKSNAFYDPINDICYIASDISCQTPYSEADEVRCNMNVILSAVHEAAHRYLIQLRKKNGQKPVPQWEDEDFTRKMHLFYCNWFFNIADTIGEANKESIEKLRGNLMHCRDEVLGRDAIPANYKIVS